MAWGITSPAVPQTSASRDCLKVAFSLPRGEEKGPILPRWVPRPRGLAAELASLRRPRPLKLSQGALSCRDDCAAVDARSRGPFRPAASVAFWPPFAWGAISGLWAADSRMHHKCRRWGQDQPGARLVFVTAILRELAVGLMPGAGER